MASVRELIATLGFKVDTGPATRFDAAVNRSKTNLENLTQVRVGIFGTRLKGMFTAAVVAATAVGVAAGAAAKKFVNVEKSLDALKFATQEGFAPLRKEIDKILGDKVLKNLISEIDLVNAALFETQEKGVKAQTLTDFLRLAALLSVQAKKPIKEVLGLITGFTVEGELGIFKLLRELPPELQELFKAAGISPAKAGFIARGEKVREALRKVEAELERNIIKQRERGLTTFKELDTAFDKLTLEIGEKTLPAFKKLNDIIIPFIERLTTFLGEDEDEAETEKRRKERRERLKEPILPEFFQKRIFDEEKIRNLSKKSFGDIFEGLKEFFTVERPGGRFDPSLDHTVINRTTNKRTTNKRDGDIIINNNITVQSGATADPAAIERGVNEAIRRNMGTAAEQSQRTTIRRGG